MQYVMEDQLRYSYNHTAVPDVNFTNPVTHLWDRMQITVSCLYSCSKYYIANYSMTLYRIRIMLIPTANLIYR